MTQATIEIDDYQVLAALTQLARNVDHLEPALKEIGAAVEASIMLNFQGQHDPDGEPWEPLSAATLARRRGGDGQILRDTGRLNSSINYQVGDFAVEIGTDVDYANVHQFGADIEHAARTQTLYFRQRADGSVGNKFVKKSRSNFAQDVARGAHTTHIPARPFVGISAADRAKILAILGRYLERSVAF